MSLSDRERRELEEIERSLYAEDPELEAAAKSTDPRAVALKRVGAGIAIGVLGVIGLVAGVALANVLVGVVGFLVMLAGAVIALRALRSVPTGMRPSG